MTGTANAWLAQTIRDDGAVEWRMLEFVDDGTLAPGDPDATVNVLTLGAADVTRRGVTKEDQTVPS
jgi:hypothetical protein